MTNRALMKIAAFLIFLWSFHGYGQDRAYARKVIDTLASEAFHGRGYVSGGQALAARFIAEEFQRMGLRAVSGNYLQTFHHNVNAFPGKLDILINGKRLQPGAQYLVDPASPPGNGRYKTKTLTLAEILEDRWMEQVTKEKSRVLLVDMSSEKALSASEAARVREFSEYLKYEGRVAARAVGFVHQGKVPWSVSTSQAFRPAFILFRDSIDGPLDEIEFLIDAEYIENYSSNNVIGYLPGAGSTDTCLVITAHYDHLGRMGRETYFPGANDNASGVALMLDLARKLKASTLKYDVYFIAFGAEEAGLIGSNYFVKNPLFPLENIKFLINLDLAGTGVEGITVVNGLEHKEYFSQLTQLNQENGLLKEVKARGEACNSDHCFFHTNGVPCFYIYTLGGTTFYHDIYDRANTLPLREYDGYFQLLYYFILGI